MESDGCIRMHCQVIQSWTVLAMVRCVPLVCSLCNRTEGHEDGEVNGMGIVKNAADDALYVFKIGRVEGMGVVRGLAAYVADMSGDISPLATFLLNSAC